MCHIHREAHLILSKVRVHFTLVYRYGTAVSNNEAVIFWERTYYSYYVVISLEIPTGQPQWVDQVTDRHWQRRQKMSPVGLAKRGKNASKLDSFITFAHSRLDIFFDINDPGDQMHSCIFEEGERALITGFRFGSRWRGVPPALSGIFSLMEHSHSCCLTLTL